MLARYSGFDSALLVRGVEGGVIPSLRQTGRFFYYRDGGQEEYVDVDPIELGIKQEVRAAPLPDNLPKTAEQGDEIAVTVDAVAVAQAAAQAGQEALQGKPGPVRDGLVYAAAACLWNLRRYDSLLSAVAAVRERLDSGKVSDYLR